MEGLDACVRFGAAFREQEYCLDPCVTFVNHGSYGSVPNRVLKRQQHYRDMMERCPDLWFRKQCFQLHLQARQTMAEFVGADLDDVALVTNATTGVNTILKSYPYKKGDAVLGTNCTYGAISNTIKHVASGQGGVTAERLDISFPIQSEEEVVTLVDRFLKEHPNVRIFVFDAITSPSAVVMPMRRLVEVCRQHGVLSLIDGAHAPGHLDLNMKDLDPDFFTGNFHKWGFSPRGAAMLYIKREHQAWVKPLVTSWRYGEGLELEFFNGGTRDLTAEVAVKDGLDFLAAVGGLARVRDYNAGLSLQASHFLQRELGLVPLAIPSSMESPYLKCLALPDFPNGPKDRPECEALNVEVIEKYKMVVPFVPIQGKTYIRISTQIYNCMEDYHRLAEVLKQLMAS